MTQKITPQSSQWIESTRFDKDLSRSYLSFDSLNAYEEIKSQESVLAQSYAAIIEGFSRSQEGIDSKELIKTFIQKAIQFVGFVINTIIKIIYNVATFFKKLFVSVMNESLMRSYGQFYESHKETIL
jgi:hypothetical protein